MTDIWSHHHRYFMGNYVRQGNELLLNKKTAVFAVHKEGNMFPVEVLIKLSPDISQGYLTYQCFTHTHRI